VSPALRPAGPDGAAGLADLCARLVRLDRAALVRLRMVPGEAAAEAWAWTPLDVLVRRRVPAGLVGAPDLTVLAAELLDALRGPDGPARPPADVALPARRDEQWRGALPPADLGDVLERVPAAVGARLVHAAGEALRTATAAGVDARRAGEALLDQEVLTVEPAERAGGAAGGAGTGGAVGTVGTGGTVGVPLRALLALARTGALPPPDDRATLEVSASPAWGRVSAPRGEAYYRRSPGLLLRPR